MPQNPIVPRPGGALSALDVSAATVIKAAPGTLVRITVLAVATADTFGAYDAATVGAAATANAIVQYADGYPAVGSVIYLQWPCNTGIVVNPGTGGAVSVAYA